MEKELFYAYMKDDQQLNKESLHQLKQIAEKHPYFETAKLMLLKNRQDTNHPEFTSELRKVAITCCDREKLFYYLNNDRYARFFPKIVTEEVSTNDRTEVLLDTFLQSLDKDEESDQIVNHEKRNEWDSNSMVTTDYIAYLEQIGDPENPLDDEEETKPMKHQDLLDRF